MIKLMKALLALEGCKNGVACLKTDTKNKNPQRKEGSQSLYLKNK